MVDLNGINSSDQCANHDSQAFDKSSSKNIYKLLFYTFFVLFFITSIVLLIVLLRCNEPIPNSNKTVSPINLPINYGVVTTSNSSDGIVKCYQNNKYFVALKNGQAENSRILVKIKSNENSDIACNSDIQRADFEFVEWITMILDLQNNYLLADTGTGPGRRGLHIYDLDKKQKVYEGSYCSKPEFVDDNTITFWVETTKEATQENCSNLAENERNGFASVIEERILLNLLTFDKQLLGEYRCAIRQ